MWAIATAIFAGCKMLTLMARRDGERASGRGLAYAFAWPGFDAEAFLSQTVKPAKPRSAEAIQAGVNALIGATLVTMAIRWVGCAPMAFGWLGMIGMVCVLHFGLFHLLSCFWRWRGIDAKPLMRRPLLSRSVGEFWGQRWNTAFRDLTHRFLFAPLMRCVGPRWAIVVGFFVSGVVHELVITVPARGGYGLPTLYFIWQGIAMLLERAVPFRRWRGRAWTIAAVALPAPMLFPPVFVERVVVPMLRALSLN